jgi:Uma2 family endonuclease
VVVGVLSETTAEFDRGAKFAHVHKRESLEEYAIVSWRERRVEHYRRVGAGQWHLTVLEGAGEIPFAALGVTVPVEEVFEGIDEVMPRS